MNSAGGVLIASIQMVSGLNWRENLDNAKLLIAESASRGAKFVVLPEFFILIASSEDTQKFDIAEDLGDGFIQNSLSEMAKLHNICLIAGSILIKSPIQNRYYNTCIVYAPDGSMICHYHKMHLFKFDDGKIYFDEGETFTSGNNIVTFVVDGVKFGIGICYDLRFPEFFRQMGHVDAIVLPAAFTYFTGKDHWEVLLRARAIENQCYVIASNQGGSHDCGRTTFGHSMIINPWGEIINNLYAGNGVITGNIDLEYLNRVRSSLPALYHKKLT